LWDANNMLTLSVPDGTREEYGAFVDQMGLKPLWKVREQL